MGNKKPYLLMARVSPYIKQEITDLAARYECSQSTVIRMLLKKGIEEVRDETEETKG